MGTSVLIDSNVCGHSSNLRPNKALRDTPTESIACRDSICDRCGRTHNHVPVIERSLCGTCPSIPASSQHASISSATIEKHRVCNSVRSRLSSLAHESMEVGFDCDMAMQSAAFRGRMRFSVKPNSRLRLSVTLSPGRRGANRPPGCGVPWKMGQLGKWARATARQAAGRVALGSANLPLGFDLTERRTLTPTPHEKAHSEPRLS